MLIKIWFICNFQKYIIGHFLNMPNLFAIFSNANITNYYKPFLAIVLVIKI